MSKTNTITIAPLAMTLANGWLQLDSWKSLRTTIIKNNPGIHNLVESTVDGQKTVYVRPEGTPTIPVSYWNNGKPQFSRVDEDRMLHTLRLVYMCVNMTKDDRNAVGLPHHSYFERKYNIRLPRYSKPRIQVVSADWLKRSPLRKILYSVQQKGIKNVFINSGVKQVFKTMEEYTKTISAFNQFHGTVWFNKKIAYSVFDIIESRDIAYVERESDLAYILNCKTAILSNMLYVNGRRRLNSEGKSYIVSRTGRYAMEYDLKSNDGRYVAQWRLEAFYANNPEGKLYAVKEHGDYESDGWQCELTLLLPEDKAQVRERTIYEANINVETEGMTEEERDEYFVNIELELAQPTEKLDRMMSSTLNPEDQYIREEFPMYDAKGEIILEHFFIKYEDILRERGVDSPYSIQEFIRRNNVQLFAEALNKED